MVSGSSATDLFHAIMSKTLSLFQVSQSVIWTKLWSCSIEFLCFSDFYMTFSLFMAS